MAELKKIFGRARELYGNSSLRHRLFAVYSMAMALLVVVIILAVYIVFRNYYFEEISKTRTDVLTQTSERVRSIKENTYTVSNLYFYDYSIRSAGVMETEAEINQTKRRLDDITDRYKFVFAGLNTEMYVLLASEEFTYCSLGDDTRYNRSYGYQLISHMPRYNEVVREDGGIVMLGSYQDFLQEQNNGYVISLARSISDMKAGQGSSLLLVNIYERVFYDAYKNILDGHNQVYIIDSSGIILSHQSQSMIGKNYLAIHGLTSAQISAGRYLLEEADGGKVMINCYYDPKSDWIIVEELSVDSIIGLVNQVRNTMMLTCLVCVLLSLGLAYFFAWRISTPLKEFCRSMRQVQDGNLNVISDIGGFQEMNQLREGFNGMTEEIRLLLQNITEKEQLKRKAELDFLQSQINPHFMYNTLFSIKCQISLGRNESAEQMMGAFIALLKIILKRSDELITLGEEMQCVEEYVLIAKFRYQDKFDFRIEIDETLWQNKIPNLLLQPLVENAIFHGLSVQREKIDILLSARKEAGDLVIRVHDNGVGMDEATISRIWENEIADAQKKQRMSMVGLMNVHQRIQLHFGDAYGLAIQSAPGEFTEITLTLPDIN